MSSVVDDAYRYLKGDRDLSKLPQVPLAAYFDDRSSFPVQIDAKLGCIDGKRQFLGITLDQ